MEEEEIEEKEEENDKSNNRKNKGNKYQPSTVKNSSYKAMLVYINILKKKLL